MNTDYIYVGCFISPSDLLPHLKNMNLSHLARMIRHPHITFCYLPKEIDVSLFGEKISVTAVAYGNDGENEGIRVELKSTNARIENMIQKIEVPHITLSVSLLGKPVNTKYLEFQPIRPFSFAGLYGGYSKDGHVITSKESHDRLIQMFQHKG